MYENNSNVLLAIIKYIYWTIIFSRMEMFLSIIFTMAKNFLGNWRFENIFQSTISYRNNGSNEYCGLSVYLTYGLLYFENFPILLLEEKTNTIIVLYHRFTKPVGRKPTKSHSPIIQRSISIPNSQNLTTRSKTN